MSRLMRRSTADFERSEQLYVASQLDQEAKVREDRRRFSSVMLKFGSTESP